MGTNQLVIPSNTYSLRNIAMLFVGLLTLQTINLSVTELACESFYELVPSSGLTLYAINEHLSLVSAMLMGYTVVFAIILLCPRLKIYKYHMSFYTNLIVCILGIPLIALYKHYPNMKSAYILCLIIETAAIGANLAACLYVGYNSTLYYVVGYLLWDCCSNATFIVAFDFLRGLGIKFKTSDLVKYEILVFELLALGTAIFWYYAYYNEYKDIIPIVEDTKNIDESSTGSLENIMAYERSLFNDLCITIGPTILVTLSAFLNLVYPIIVPYAVLESLNAIAINLVCLYTSIIPAVIFWFLGIFNKTTPERCWKGQYWYLIGYLGIFSLTILGILLFLLYFPNSTLFRIVYGNIFVLGIMITIAVFCHSLMFVVGISGSGYQIQPDPTLSQYLVDDSRGKMTVTVMLFYLMSLNVAIILSFVYIETYKVYTGIKTFDDPPTISTVIMSSIKSYFSGEVTKGGYMLLKNEE